MISDASLPSAYALLRLSASVGPSGAVAQIETDAAAAGRRETSSLVAESRQGTRADPDRAGRADHDRSHGRHRHSDREVLRQRGLASGYLKALRRLGGAQAADTALALIAPRGTTVQVATGAGRDAVAIAGDRVDGVSTGGGADAVVITGSEVSNIRTDGPGRSRQPGADGDALAIAAGSVDTVRTGRGSDAVAILAGIATDIRTGRGDDALTVDAGVVGGIHAGRGDDTITVRASLGLQAALNAAAAADGAPDQAAASLLTDPIARFKAALSGVADVSGGSGDDTIAVSGAEVIGVAGDAGDDTILISGRTVGLHYGLGDGHDVVAIGAGTDVVLQLGLRPDHGGSPSAYAVTRSDDVMRIDFAEGGSITFTGMREAGIIAIADPVNEPVILNLAPPATADLRL